SSAFFWDRPVAVPLQDIRWPLRQPPAIAAALAAAMLCVTLDAALSQACKPRHSLPTIVLKNRGECDFNLDALEFRGTPAEQALCLMRGLDGTRELTARRQSLPDALATRIGREAGLPPRETLSAFLSKQDLEWDFAAHLWEPVSRSEDNNPE